MLASKIIMSPTEGEGDGNRSFFTQVISYSSRFVPFWSFRTHFYF